MSGRYRTVALQAVGVAVLAAFVFIAFLRPSEPGDLTGIDAPGGGDGPTVVNPGPPDKRNKGRKNGDDKNRLNGNDRPGGPGASGSDRRGGGDPGGGPGTPPSGDGGGPDDDQYTDLVTVLMEQVGRPSLFREIDR